MLKNSLQKKKYFLFLNNLNHFQINFFSSTLKTSKTSLKTSLKTQNNSQNDKIIWYPGHIAKAEKELVNYLKLVDVVLEVRDARILSSTSHPSVKKWVGNNRPIFVIISRIDQVTKRCIIDWKAYYNRYPPYPNSKVFFIDGNRGGGIERLRTQILKTGVQINQKRANLGIEPRSVRAAVIGYPNVGKSSLINRLLNRKLAPVQNIAGFTKTIRWVRISDKDKKTQKTGIELLDSPGIIPPRLDDQNSAMALAICNDIGQASYDKYKAAISLCDRVIKMNKERKGYVSIPSINSRYKISFDGNLSGEQIVNLYAEKYFHSNELQASDKLLGDFRKGYWGVTALEYPPNIHEIDEQRNNEKNEIKNIDNNEEEIDINEENTNETNEFDETNDNIDNLDIVLDNSEENNEQKTIPKIGLKNSSKNSSKERFIPGSSDSGAYDGW